MTAETSQVLEHLHDLLGKLEDAQGTLAHGPRRIAAARKKVEAQELACTVQKDVIKSLRKRADQKTLSLKSREAEIAKLNQRLNEASSNKEYGIIEAQVEAARSANLALEDEILSLLTQVDEASDELQRHKEESARLEAKLEAVTAEVHENEPGLQADIARLEGEISEAERAIESGDARTTYKRLRLSIGAGALAEVRDAFCTACNTRMTPQDGVRVNMGEFVLCRECGRILYSVDHELAE